MGGIVSHPQERQREGLFFWGELTRFSDAPAVNFDYQEI